MAGFYWFGAGCVVGVLYGWSLWRLVLHLDADRVGRALILTWAGTMVRCVGVAVLLFVALGQGIVAGLSALVGFLLVRLGWTWFVALSVGAQSSPPQG